MKKLALLLGALLLASPAPVKSLEKKAQEPRTSIESAFVDFSYKTKYVTETGFTGIENPIIQNTMGFGTKRFDLAAWSCYDPSKSNIPEINVWTDIPIKLSDKLGTKLFAGYFTFPAMELPDMQEVGVKFTPKTPYLDTKVYAGHLFGGGEGSGEYVSTTLSKGFNPHPKVDINLSAKVSWNNNYMTDRKGFSHTAQNASISLNAGKGYIITPHITTQQPLEDKFDGTFKTETTSGVTVSKTF